MPADHNPAVETDLVNMTNSPASPAGTALYSWEGDKIVYFTSVNASSSSDIYILGIYIINIQTQEGKMRCKIVI